MLEGGEDPKLYDDVDAFNAGAALDAVGKSTDELLGRWTAAHDGVIETLGSLPDDAPKLAFEIFEWNTTGHYPDHYADIGAAVRGADDLLGLIQTNWLDFRAGLACVGLVVVGVLFMQRGARVRSAIEVQSESLRRRGRVRGFDEVVIGGGQLEGWVRRQRSRDKRLVRVVAGADPNGCSCAALHRSWSGTFNKGLAPGPYSASL